MTSEEYEDTLALLSKCRKTQKNTLKSFYLHDEALDKLEELLMRLSDAEDALVGWESTQ